VTPDKIVLTLQYCLETFEQACQCGECDPCTQGQADIKEAIAAVETLTASARRVHKAWIDGEIGETRTTAFDALEALEKAIFDEAVKP